MERIQNAMRRMHRYIVYDLPSTYQRARAYMVDFYQWHLAQVPEHVEFRGETIRNPGRWNAIFVVHGMGMQRWTETAVTFRSGFEAALEDIFTWQDESVARPDPREVPVPYIHEGFWADYDDLTASMPEESQKLGEHEEKFFAALWTKRTHSVVRTFFWFVWQQFRLLNPSIIWRIHLFAWLVYIPLQIASLAVLLVSLIRFPKVLSQVLADVRLYVEPQGVIERAIVQRIDQRVGASFLQMLGLDWEFRRLPDEQKIFCGHAPIEFDQVTWVAHSLGTVISYNVLSDLFARAREIDGGGDAEQKEGVARFRRSFRRFVTLGSPLDKIAFLFGETALRPWTEDDRLCFWNHADRSQFADKESYDWWINFYHVLDPVSGSLSNRTICYDKPPRNLHMKLWKIPGFAHSAYWSDRTTLRYILGRVYGKAYLPDKEYTPYRPWVLTLIAIFGYLVWVGILFAFIYAVVYGIANFAEVKDDLVKFLFRM